MEHEVGAHSCTDEVSMAGPVDLRASLEGFRRSGDDLLDRWDGEVLRRVLPGSRGPLPVAVRVIGDVAEPRLQVTVADPVDLAEAVSALGAMVVTAPAALDRLGAVDAVIARAEMRHRGVRPVLSTSVLTALVRAISAQQVNLRWAATTRSRLALSFGNPHRVGGGEVWDLDAEWIATTDPAELRALQFTTAKSVAIVGIAQAVVEGRLALAELSALDDDSVIDRLVALRGIGRWTAEWFLARTLGRPRVVAGDLGVRKAVAVAYGRGPIVSEAEVRAITRHWGEAAGVAQQLLLHALGQGDLDAAAAGTPAGQ